MKTSLTAILSVVIGLGLALGLLYPDADRDELTAQGTTALLGLDLTEAFPDGLGVAAGLPLEASVFAALDAALNADVNVSLAADATAPSIAVSVTLDGVLTDETAFRRAFGTNLNLYNALRLDASLPPLTAVDQAADAPLQLDIFITRDDTAVSFAARIHDGTFHLAITPADASGASRSWSFPGRGALVPPLLAILLALAFKRVILALFCGIWAGAVLFAIEQGGGTIASVFVGLWNVFAVYLANEVVDTFRIEIIGFVVWLVAMVGIMSRSGGVQGMVELLLRFANSVRSTLAVTWGMGLLIFFDDYANCLLVGNTMRPLTDRMRISREKLAYIVDSTAAPIAGLSLLSTWIAFEVSTYSAQLPGAGITDSAYAVFLQTLPFRYYCLFTLLFVGLVIFTGRDYGPMARAERRARLKGELVRKGGRATVGEEMTRIEPKPGLPLSAGRALWPIACVLAVTFWRIFEDGGGRDLWNAGELSFSNLESWQQVLFDGSGGAPIFLGSFFGMLLAVFLAGSVRTRMALATGLVLAAEAAPALARYVSGRALAHPDPIQQRLADMLPAESLGVMSDSALPLYLCWGLIFGLTAWIVGRSNSSVATTRPHLAWSDIRSSGLASVKSLFFAVLILFSAWMIGKVCVDLKTADYLVAIMSDSVSAGLLPVLLFFIAAIVALATGSSWSTMSILLPNVVALAAAVGVEAGMGATAMVVMSIGAVLEGSIFGDHCSPISDTTVLSSVSSASDHVDHVRTQAPYALTTAAAAMLFGYLPSLLLDWWNLWLALGSALVAMTLLLLTIGKKTPDAPPAARTAAPSTSDVSSASTSA